MWIRFVCLFVVVDMFGSVIMTHVEATSVLFLSFSLFHYMHPTVSAAGGSWHTPATGCVCVCVCVCVCACIHVSCWLILFAVQISAHQLQSQFYLERALTLQNTVRRVQSAQHIIDDLGDFIQPKAPSEELSHTDTHTNTHTNSLPYLLYCSMTRH